MTRPRVQRVTPVLVVRDVKPSAEFWERLGFTRTVEVPHEDTLGFVILARDEIEIMYQSEASVRADAPSVAAATIGSTTLFAEVNDLDAVAKAVDSAPIVLPRRTTFYGMHEIGVREPGGHVVIFAQRAEA